MPTISVAMATYNGATYLREQLDSIAAQRHLPIELVIGDDGSSDDTIEVAKAFAAQAPFPVRIFRNAHNLGFADNFLCTAERCTGEWIAFCDQDDVWYPNKLARIASEIEARGKQELVMVCHIADVVDASLAKTGRRMPTIARTHVSPANSQPGFWCMGGCVMAVRGDLVRDLDFRRRPADDYHLADTVPGGRAQMAHDKWISLLSNALGDTLFLAEPLACYRRHDRAVTGAHDGAPMTTRLRLAAATGSISYEHRGVVSQKAAALLREFATQSDTARSARLRTASENFDRLAQNLLGRSKLYDQQGVRERLRQLLALLMRGAYFGDNFSRLGVKSLLKDVVYSIASGTSARDRK